MTTLTTDPTSLANLHDIIVPEPVPLWPLAPGWYGVGWILVIGCLGLLVVFIRSRRANRYRRVALAELNQLETAVHDPARRALALADLPPLVKRVALAGWPRETVAALSGSALLEFLDATGRTQAFKVGPGKWLSALAYDSRAAAALTDEHITPLFGVVRDWIKWHSTLAPSLPKNRDCNATRTG